VAVSISRAGEVAKSAEFKEWWDSAGTNPTHEFFRSERNDALKDVTDAIVLRNTTDGWGGELVYWVFPHGPHAQEPLVPMCQKYNNWLYFEMWVPACEHLYYATLADRDWADVDDSVI
jgi:hypothetical protein